MTKFQRLNRLIEMITLLRGQSNLGPRDLSEHFGVSVKRIHDDIRELNAAGVPIIYDRVGYKILPSFFLPPMQVSGDEAIILILALRLLDAYGPNTKDGRNLRLSSKLIAALPENLQQKIKNFSNYLDARTPYQYAISNSIIDKLCHSVHERERIIATYHTASRDIVTKRQIDPYLIVYRHNSWYLIGYCWKRNSIRTFKIIRFKEIKLTGLHFPQPADFDVNEYFEKTWELMRGEEEEIVIRFSHKVAPYIKEKNFTGGSIKAEKNGSILLNLTTRSREEVKWWILSYGADAKVLAPADLVKEMRQIANNMASLYKPNKKSKKNM